MLNTGRYSENLLKKTIRGDMYENQSMFAIQNLFQCVRKFHILLLRPFRTPLRVLAGTKELFVFVPPQHEGIHVVSSVLQAVLIQHSGT